MRGMAAPGYPGYFVTIPGFWKLLVGLEFLTGAAFSHASVGDPAAKVVVPLAFIGIAVTSWLLRPASRRLNATKIGFLPLRIQSEIQGYNAKCIDEPVR
jgi:hypothetical protein